MIDEMGGVAMGFPIDGHFYFHVSCDARGWHIYIRKDDQVIVHVFASRRRIAVERGMDAFWRWASGMRDPVVEQDKALNWSLLEDPDVAHLELLPEDGHKDSCPFCGSSDTIVCHAFNGDFVHCSNCHASGPKATKVKRQDPVKVWNKRHSDPDPLGQALNEGDGVYRP